MAITSASSSKGGSSSGGSAGGGTGGGGAGRGGRPRPKFAKGGTKKKATDLKKQANAVAKLMRKGNAVKRYKAAIFRARKNEQRVARLVSMAARDKGLRSSQKAALRKEAKLAVRTAKSDARKVASINQIF